MHYCDGDMQVAKLLFRNAGCNLAIKLFCYNFLMNGPIKTICKKVLINISKTHLHFYKIFKNTGTRQVLALWAFVGVANLL